MKILVRGTDKASGFLSGHTEGKIVVRFASKNQKLVGQFVTLKITSVTPFSMEGDGPGDAEDGGRAEEGGEAGDAYGDVS